MERRQKEKAREIEKERKRDEITLSIKEGVFEVKRDSYRDK